MQLIKLIFDYYYSLHIYYNYHKAIEQYNERYSYRDDSYNGTGLYHSSNIILYNFRSFSIIDEEYECRIYNITFSHRVYFNYTKHDLPKNYYYTWPDKFELYKFIYNIN